MHKAFLTEWKGVTVMSDLKQLRMGLCWKHLRESLVQDEWVNQNPIDEIAKYASDAFNLSAPSAKQSLAYPLLKFLEKNNHIEVVRDGRGTITLFRIINNDKVSFLPTNGKVKSANNVPDFLKKAIDEACQNLENRIGAAVGSIIEQQLKSKIKKRLKEDRQHDKRIAVWIDGPNISNAARKAGMQLPVRPMLEELTNHGNVVFAVVFNNGRCPEKILRMYKRMGIVNVTCVSPKEGFDAAYDPVDDEIKRIVPALADVANIHIIGSMDRHFEPVISQLQQQGKIVAQLQIDEVRRIAALREIGGQNFFGYRVLRTRKFQTDLTLA